jgi:hypothetical protein
LSSAAWQEIRVRFGRDDTSFSDVGVCYGEFGNAEGRTADPSTALRSSRDDKGESGALKEGWLVAEGEQQVPPLRSPGFPVELDGCLVQCSMAGNPGTLRSG